jgi:hypothetical protein
MLGTMLCWGRCYAGDDASLTHLARQMDPLEEATASIISEEAARSATAMSVTAPECSHVPSISTEVLTTSSPRVWTWRSTKLNRWP